MKRTALIAGLFLAALTLRPQLVGAGPLLPSIESDLDVSHAVAGLLGTIPILCMGIFAPPASFLANRLGTRTALAFSLGLIGAFGLLRVAFSGVIALILLTVPVGVGMGFAGALIPVWVKERFSDRPAFVTSVYATGISVGSALSSAVAVPLRNGFGTWRAPLLVFSGVTAGLALLWLWLTRREATHVRIATPPLHLPLRSALAWRMVTAFLFMSIVYYGLNSWLADAYTERGWSDGAAGALVALLNGMGIASTFLVGWVADRWGSRRAWLGGSATVLLVGLLGIVLAPGAAWLWVVLCGGALGPMFPLTLTLPVDASARPSDVASLAGMMLGVGYTLSAIAPLALGAIRDATGGFTAVLWVLVGAGAILVAVDSSFTRERLGAARWSRERPPAAASS